MKHEIMLGDVMIDCDDEKGLQRFYSELLGWEMCELYDRPAVRSSSGIVFLFMEEQDYIRPIWPEVKEKQQKQMHFDFQVSDVLEMVKKAESLGAVKKRPSMAEKILSQCSIRPDIPFVYARADSAH